MSEKKNKKKDYLNTNCLSEDYNFEIYYTSSFLKNLKKYFKTKSDLSRLCEAVKELSKHGNLINPKYKAHNLKGKLKEYREAHLKNDLLIVWKIENDSIVMIIAAGTHSDLFD
ncbi:MAG: type II toxin-antitoxin system YafQ family toxin [Bacteroidales bacterium]|nr:type II toxin-antitoxin system YafQ family toxin [Bacteroidales bacterium]